MCREMNREPAWVAAIRLAMLEGYVDTEAVIEEANLTEGRERTVCDVLSTLNERDLLESTGDGAYRPGRVLLESDRFDRDFERASTHGVHNWKSPV